MERVDSVLNSPAGSFPDADRSRWLPGLDKTDTVGDVKRSAPDHRHPTPPPDVPAAGAPASGMARKETPTEHAAPEAGAPGMKPVGR